MNNKVALLLLALSLGSYSFSRQKEIRLSDIYENSETHLLKSGAVEMSRMPHDSILIKLKTWKEKVLAKTKYLRETKGDTSIEYKFLLPFVIYMRTFGDSPPMPFSAHHYVKLRVGIGQETVNYSLFDIGNEFNLKSYKKEENYDWKNPMMAGETTLDASFNKKEVIRNGRRMKEQVVYDRLVAFNKAANRLVRSLEKNLAPKE